MGSRSLISALLSASGEPGSDLDVGRRWRVRVGEAEADRLLGEMLRLYRPYEHRMCIEEAGSAAAPRARLEEAAPAWLPAEPACASGAWPQRPLPEAAHSGWLAAEAAARPALDEPARASGAGGAGDGPAAKAPRLAEGLRPTPLSGPSPAPAAAVARPCQGPLALPPLPLAQGAAQGPAGQVSVPASLLQTAPHWQLLPAPALPSAHAAPVLQPALQQVPLHLPAQRPVEPRLDWGAPPMEPFTREFVVINGALDQEETRARRDALGVAVEYDPEGVRRTPAPVLSFPEAGVLPEWVLEALAQNGWSSPKPLQAQALPIVLAGRDLVSVAPAGSGKTGAFLLPAIVHIEDQEPLSSARPGPIAVLLAPSREQAVHAGDQVAMLLKPSWRSEAHPGGLRSAVFHGGASKAPGAPAAAAPSEAHVVVATPRRLLDLVAEGSLRLARVTYLALGEADRMLDLGFSHDVRRISALVRPDRQALVFSAQWNEEVEALALELCPARPARLRVGLCGALGGGGAAAAAAAAPPAAAGAAAERMPAARGAEARRGGWPPASGGAQPPWPRAGGAPAQAAAEASGGPAANAHRVQQEVVVFEHPGGDWQAAAVEKRKMLQRHVQCTLGQCPGGKLLVFVNTRRDAEEICQQLSASGYQAASVHGGVHWSRRPEAIDQLRRGTVRVLVTTSAIGPGTETPSVSHVVIYDFMGYTVENYVDSVGRASGGDGIAGHALTFFEFDADRPSSASELAAELERTGQPVPRELRRLARQAQGLPAPGC